MKKLIAILLSLCVASSFGDGTPMPLSTAFYFNVTTAVSGGTFTNADSAPTWTLLKNGSTVITTGTFTVAGTGTLAGNYYGSLTLNSASFAVSDTYALEATGTISAVPVKVIVQQGRVLPAETVSGYPLADVGKWAGSTPNALISGRVDAKAQGGTIDTVATATTVTNRVTTGGGTIDLANAVGTLAASQSFNNGGQTTAMPADVTKYNGTATKWGSNAPGDLHTGTAQGSGDPSEIILAAGASATNDLYLGNVISILSGTGAGQSRVINDYTGSSKVAAVARAWTTQPDNTSVYAVRADISPSISDTLGVNVSYWSGTGVEAYATAANLATLTGYVDTEVAAIKTKTDFLPSATAGASGGVLIAGSNAGTTFATLTSTGAFTINGTANVAQTGDSFARLGAPSGASIDADILTRLATSGYTAPNNSGITSIKTVTDALNTSLELDGLVYRFTTNALEQAPAGGGGGGGFTTDDRTLLQKIGAKQGVRVP
jgi:hypothetical protein